MTYKPKHAKPNSFRMKNKDLFDLRNIFIEHNADGDYLSISFNNKVIFDGTTKEMLSWLEEPMDMTYHNIRLGCEGTE